MLDFAKKETIVNKILLVTALLCLPAIASAALPPHDKDGWRDTGCDEYYNVPITNDEGVVLYWNNETCPDVGGAGFVLDAPAAAVVTPPPPPPPPVECKKCAPPPPPSDCKKCGPKK